MGCSLSAVFRVISSRKFPCPQPQAMGQNQRPCFTTWPHAPGHSRLDQEVNFWLAKSQLHSLHNLPQKCKIQGDMMITVVTTDLFVLYKQIKRGGGNRWKAQKPEISEAIQSLRGREIGTSTPSGSLELVPRRYGNNSVPASVKLDCIFTIIPHYLYSLIVTVSYTELCIYISLLWNGAVVFCFDQHFQWTHPEHFCIVKYAVCSWLHHFLPRNFTMVHVTNTLMEDS